MNTKASLSLLAIFGATGCAALEQTPPSDPVQCELTEVSWTEGTQAFAEATEPWGLAVIGVRGLRLSVVDYDGDGWSDLLVRRGSGPDDFSADGTRSRWLLRNNTHGRFEDVTESSGLLVGRLMDTPNGGLDGELMISGDVDNDGVIDIVIAKALQDPSSVAGETTEVMMGDGSGGFRHGPEASDLRNGGHPTVPNGIAFTDVNLDGFLDLWMSNNKRGNDNSPLQDRLYLGQGDGSFLDGTDSLGLTTRQWNSVEALNEGRGHTWGWGATACDLNNDGIPELLSASYGRVPNQLWQGENDGAAVSYENRSVASGYAFDERSDWTTNMSAQCYCEDNPSAEDCDLTPPPEANCAQLAAAFGPNYRWNHSQDREPWRLGGNSATTTCADVDNDGFFDLLTGEIVHWDVGSSSDPAELLFNEGGSEVSFARPGNATTGFERDAGEVGWDHGDMNNTIFDFDNDGWLDVYISASDYPGNRGLLFQQVAPRLFESVPTGLGIDHNRSAGAVTADFDRDGDLDLVVGHSRMRCGGASGADCYEDTQVRYFENLVGSANRWLQLQLRGAGGSNHSAIGARVAIEVCGLTITRQVDGGHGHQAAQDDKVLHFGLADQEEVSVAVTWPDAAASSEQFTLQTNSRYVLEQGEEPERLGE